MGAQASAPWMGGGEVVKAIGSVHLAGHHEEAFTMAQKRQDEGLDLLSEFP